MSKRPEDYNCHDHEKEFVEMIKAGVIERIKNYEGREQDLSELGFDLTECEYTNGSWYCDSWKTEQDLSWFFSVLERYFEWTRFEGTPLNMTDEEGYLEIERVHCNMMRDAYCNVVNRAIQDLEDYNEYHQTIQIDEKFIEAISQYINKKFNEVDDIF